MQPQWVELVLDYLAHREPELLEQARQATSTEPDIIALIDAHKEMDFAEAERLAETLVPTLLEADRMREALAVALLFIDLRVRLVSFYNQFPLEQQMQALQAGLEACRTSKQYAEMLESTPCTAFYLGNLGNGLYACRELQGARAAYEEALALRRQLASVQPGVYLPNVATTLNNLGTVLRALRELQGARTAYEEALALRRQLASVQPGVYLPDVAMTLNNLGNVLRDLLELQGARTAYEEGLALRRQLASVQPGVYLPNVAMTLNNLGTVLRDLRELQGARTAYEEALALRRQLASVQPGVYLIEVAGTLSNLGFLEDGEDRKDLARRHFEQCLQCCEQGMSTLSLAESQNRYAIKGRIESACLWLIEDYARRAAHNGEETREHLIGLMESLRRIETLSGVGSEEMPGAHTWKQVYADLRSGSGPTARRLREGKSALLWLHVTEHSLVIVSQAPGEAPQVEVADRSVFDTLHSLLMAVVGAFDRHTEIVQAWDKTQKALNLPNQPAPVIMLLQRNLQEIQRRAEEWHNQDKISQAGEAAFLALPERVRALLTDPDYHTIFLAPCSQTILLPFELLHIPNRGYLGLGRQLPRIHGLAELANVIDRQPDLSAGWKALVVGEPTFTGATPLQYAAEMTEKLATMLEQHGDPVPNVALSSGANATRTAVLTVLEGDRPALWAFNGHGSYPDVPGGATSLLLAGTDRLYPQEVARLKLPGTFVQLDCCNVGLTLARGGGRFDGFPTACLAAGASCVLSSVHPLFDQSSMKFSEALYGMLLNGVHSLPVGEALLEARRIMARQHANPLLWATTVLWGNPGVTLKKSGF